MSAERDVNRIVRSWLRTDEHESADTVLQTVLSRLDTTPQRRSWWPTWRSNRMNTYAKLLAAAAAVLVVAVVGYQFLPRNGGPGGLPTASITPTPSEVVGSPIDGTYTTSFTRAELAASPLLVDAEEINDGNWGDWRFKFDQGRVSYSQHNAVASSSSSGTFTVTGDALVMSFDTGANKGETFGYRWRLSGNVLTLARDETLGPGPTPFLVKPWSRVAG